MPPGKESVGGMMLAVGIADHLYRLAEPVGQFEGQAVLKSD